MCSTRKIPHDRSSAKKSLGAADVGAAAAAAVDAAGEAAGAAAAAAAAAGPGPRVFVAGARLQSLLTRVTGPGLARPGHLSYCGYRGMLTIRLYHRRPAPQRRGGGHRQSLLRGRPITI